MFDDMTTTEIDFDQMPTLGDIARYHANQRPDSIVFRFEGRETTFSAFERYADVVAERLGDRVRGGCGQFGSGGERGGLPWTAATKYLSKTLTLGSTGSHDRCRRRSAASARCGASPSPAANSTP